MRRAAELAQGRGGRQRESPDRGAVCGARLGGRAVDTPPPVRGADGRQQLVAPPGGSDGRAGGRRGTRAKGGGAAGRGPRGVGGAGGAPEGPAPRAASPAPEPPKPFAAKALRRRRRPCRPLADLLWSDFPSQTPPPSGRRETRSTDVAGQALHGSEPPPTPQDTTGGLSPVRRWWRWRQRPLPDLPPRSCARRVGTGRPKGPGWAPGPSLGGPCRIGPALHPPQPWGSLRRGSGLSSPSPLLSSLGGDRAGAGRRAP